MDEIYSQDPCVYSVPFRPCLHGDFTLIFRGIWLIYIQKYNHSSVNLGFCCCLHQWENTVITAHKIWKVMWWHLLHWSVTEIEVTWSVTTNALLLCPQVYVVLLQWCKWVRNLATNFSSSGTRMLENCFGSHKPASLFLGQTLFEKTVIWKAAAYVLENFVKISK